MTLVPVLPGSTLSAGEEESVAADDGGFQSSSSIDSPQPPPIRVEAINSEYKSAGDLRQEVEELNNVRVTRGLMKFDNDGIELEYAVGIVAATLKTRIIPLAVALFLYSLYSLEFSKWYDSTPSVEHWHTTDEILFNLSWIYHILSSIAMFIIGIVPARSVYGPRFEIITQVWLNVGVWAIVLFGNRWRSAKMFGDDHASSSNAAELEQDAFSYPSDADLLLLLHGILTYLCILTPTRARLLLPLAVTICLSYGGTSLILGGPNGENQLPHFIMLLILVCMVMSGKMNLEKVTRQHFIASNIEARNSKLLEYTVRDMNTGRIGLTTTYEKAFTDIEAALKLLEDYGSRGSQVNELSASMTQELSDVDNIVSNISVRSTEYTEQILWATSRIRDSVKILSRRTNFDRVVFEDDESSTEERQEARRDFIEYINHILNQDSTPNELEQEWTLMTGAKVTLNPTPPTYVGHIPPEACEMLQAVGSDFNLNLIELQEIHLPNMPVLPLIGSQLVPVLIFDALKIERDILRRFVTRIADIYTEVEYHNQLHAAQVTSHGEYLLHATGMPVSALDHTAFLVACICHDVGHSGKNNGFYVETNDRLALRYNDRSVLEQFHVATTFELMVDFPECNILENFTREERKRFRSLVIELILATDMAKHFALLTDFRLVLRDSEFRVAVEDPMNFAERLLILKACIKAADIGHTCLPWEQHYELSLRLTEEFFKQGDQEKELNVPISPLCDRDAVNLPRSQLGFFSYLVMPCIEIVGKLGIDHRADIMEKQLKANIDGWKAEENQGKTEIPAGWSYRPVRQQRSPTRRHSRSRSRPRDESVVSSNDRRAVTSSLHPRSNS